MSESKEKQRGSNPQVLNNDRLPHCQRCAQHKIRSRLRGHKSICPFRDCECMKCLIVVQKQRLMADQIKLRRQQRKQRNLHKIRMAIEQTSVQAVQPKPDPIQKQTSSEQRSLFPTNLYPHPYIFIQSLFNRSVRWP